jgi:hypothetical protein
MHLFTAYKINKPKKKHAGYIKFQESKKTLRADTAVKKVRKD